MTASRTVTIVVGAGLLAAWFAAANGSRPAVPPLPARAPAADPQVRQIQQLLEETNRLHSAMAAMAAPREPSRNPFQFGSARAAGRAEAGDADHARADAPMAAPAAPAGPSFDLEGVADDGQGGLTAIIAGEGRLFLVRPGDLVTSQYRVKNVSVGAVDLEALAGGAILHLEMH